MLSVSRPDLVRAYASYFDGSDDLTYLVRSIGLFSGNMFSPEITSQLIGSWEQSKASTANASIFKTSGSMSGSRRDYLFAPHSVLQSIERFCKHPHGKVFTILLANRNTEFGHEPLDEVYDHFLYGRFCPEVVSFFCGVLRDLRLRHGKLAIWPERPNVLLYLNSFAEFRDFIVDQQVEIITTGCVPFFKKDELLAAGMHINNNMISWFDGLNFYTCRYNRKHCLPIFALDDGVIFLLNACCRSRQQPDDYFEASAAGICHCDKTAYDLKFRPHVSRLPDIYDEDLAEKLAGHYQNLQFIQTESDLYIYHVGTTQLDEDLLRSLSPSVKFVENKAFQVVTKRPAFYKCLEVERIFREIDFE